MEDLQNPSETTKLLKGKVIEGNLGKKKNHNTITLSLNYNYLKVSGSKVIELNTIMIDTKVHLCFLSPSEKEMKGSN